MCYILKEYVYIFIILALVNVKVSCNVEDYFTKHNILTSSAERDYNSYTSDEIPLFNLIHSNKRYEKENQQNYKDIVIFPEDDYDSDESTTTPSPQVLERCVDTCNKNITYDAVCGTDNVTYINLERLVCRRLCGDDVRLRRLSPCPGWSETTTPSPIIDNEIFTSCVSLCPSTPEYNPVCGTNNVTYFNYGRLFCAQICGADVQVERQAPCPTRPPTTTESIFSSTSIPYEQSREYFKCLENCPSTSEYNPVCGTNDRTYYNIGKLYCAKSCGVDVAVFRHSSCSIEISINLNINNNKNEVSTTTTTTTPRTDDFTIPQDILDSIFNNHGDEDDKTAEIDFRNNDELY